MGGKSSKERSVTKSGSKTNVTSTSGTGSTTALTPKKPDASTSSPSGSPTASTPAPPVSPSTANGSNTKKGSTIPQTPPEIDPPRSQRDLEKSDKKHKKNATPKGKSEVNDSAFSQKRLEDLFLKYKEADDDQIGPDGMTQFCADLEVDPADVIMLVIAYHLNAQRMGYFTKDEFMKGFTKMNIDSIAKLKAQFSSLRDELNDESKFKEIYRYAFNFGKEPDQKILELQMGIGILELVMADRPHAKSFVKFLGEQTSYKALNLDQWLNFLDFSRTIKQDFSNYDENSAWPVILDEYAAWCGKKK